MPSGTDTLSAEVENLKTLLVDAAQHAAHGNALLLGAHDTIDNMQDKYDKLLQDHNEVKKELAGVQMLLNKYERCMLQLEKHRSDYAKGSANAQ